MGRPGAAPWPSRRGRGGRGGRPDSGGRVPCPRILVVGGGRTYRVRHGHCRGSPRRTRRASLHWPAGRPVQQGRSDRPRCFRLLRAAGGGGAPQRHRRYRLWRLRQHVLCPGAERRAAAARARRWLRRGAEHGGSPDASRFGHRDAAGPGVQGHRHRLDAGDPHPERQAPVPALRH